MDPIVLTSLITSIASFAISILTHIRYSKCGACEIETKDTEQRERANSRDPLLDVEPKINSNRSSPSRNSPKSKRKSKTNTPA